MIRIIEIYDVLPNTVLIYFINGNTKTKID